MKFNWLCALTAVAALGFPIAAAAQSTTPAMPTLTADQAAKVNQQIAAERATMEARVGRGEVTPDEAERFLAWREWQVARQVTGEAPAPSTAPPMVEPAPRYVYSPPPYYYYPPAPYYWGPRYYWGASVCAGGWGHHGGARVCF